MKTSKDCNCFKAIRQIWDTHEKHVAKDCYADCTATEGAAPCWDGDCFCHKEICRPHTLCNCPCHTTPNREVDDWEKEFDEEFPTVLTTFAGKTRPFGNGGITNIETKHINFEIKDFIRAHRSQLLSSIRGEIKRLKRPNFIETNTYSEVQQENAWYNDAVRDILSIPLLNEKV